MRGSRRTIFCTFVDDEFLGGGIQVTIKEGRADGKVGVTPVDGHEVMVVCVTQLAALLAGAQVQTEGSRQQKRFEAKCLLFFETY